MRSSFIQRLRLFTLTGAMAGALLAVSPAFADVVVVVSAKSPVGPLTGDQISEVFLGKTSTVGSVNVVPVDLAEGNATRDEFYQKFVGKSAPQLKAYWSKLIFSGKGQPPKELPDNAAVKKAVNDNPNTVGYIEKSAVDASVKVVSP